MIRVKPDHKRGKLVGEEARCRSLSEPEMGARHIAVGDIKVYEGVQLAPRRKLQALPESGRQDCDGSR